MREKCFGAHILSPSLYQKNFPDVDILSRNGILLVLLGKIIILLGNLPRSANKIQFFNEISTSGKKLLI